MKILIRADANAAVGMGHIMRCLSIADAFTSTGNSVCFVLADDTVHSLVESRGYEAIVLNSNYKKMEEELSLWPTDISASYLIVDSYYVTADYLSTLRERMNTDGGKLVYLDDVYTFPYPVDILFDYNAYATPDIYDKLYGSSEVKVPKMVLGTTYAPLRSMFREIPKRSQMEAVTNILISTGGSDELHLALSLIRYLHDNRRNGECIYHFLIGAMNEDKIEIKRVASGTDNIVIHENVSDMRSLIERMDLAISAAGSTLYEIAACGVPLITYSLADNQIPGGGSFEKLGLGMYIGDLRDPTSIDKTAVMSGTLDSSAVQRILSAADELANDYERRMAMGTRMQELIDGFGADRMVKEILSPPNDSML